MALSKNCASITVLFFAAAFAAGAQPLYRWTDEQGRVHITDTPPPASARNVERRSGGTQGPSQPQEPYELRLATRDYPVTLYTAPECKQFCADARALLNKRGVPFKEIQVLDEAAKTALERLSGGTDVPTLVVGRSVHRGYAEAPYQALLDSARYPRAGLLPPRNQGAPAAPESSGTPAQAPARPESPPPGPYSPRPQR